MTKLYKELCTFVFILLIGLQAYSQFEGRIYYQVTYKTDDSSVGQYISLLPSESILTIKGNASRFEQPIAGGGRQVFISNSEDDSGVLLMNFIGEEFYVRLDKESISTLQKIKPYPVISDEGRKNILGLSCKKAFGINGNDTLTVYFNDTMYNGMLVPQFPDLGGLPMDYEVKQNNLHMHFVAKKIEKGNVTLETFVIPRNVKEISFEEFAKHFAEPNVPVAAQD